VPSVSRRLSLLLGLASLAVVIVVALQFAESRDLVRLARHASPWWLLAALALQAITYPLAAQVWRVVAAAAGTPLRLGAATEIALAKLFVDQALPSGGVSGGVMLADALALRRVSRPVIAATISIGLTSYYLAYAITLAAALLIEVGTGHGGVVVIATSLGFMVFAVLVAHASRALARGHAPLVRRLPGLARLGEWLAGADRGLVDDRRLRVRAIGYQLAIAVVDAVTLWTLLRAIGSDPPIAGVFASFMLASLFRTISIIPGGLGVFEAAGIMTLTQIGVSTAAGLSATLLFRGVSYWLPMLPGIVASRRLRRGAPA
jgi:Mg2+-importing ATPase